MGSIFHAAAPVERTATLQEPIQEPDALAFGRAFDVAAKGTADFSKRGRGHRGNDNGQEQVLGSDLHVAFESDLRVNSRFQLGFCGM